MTNKKQASIEIVNRLISDMHLTLVSSYKELIADLRMAEVLKRNNLHRLDTARVRRLAKSCSLTKKGTFSVAQITQMRQITQICEIKINQCNQRD